MYLLFKKENSWDLVSLNSKSSVWYTGLVLPYLLIYIESCMTPINGKNLKKRERESKPICTLLQWSLNYVETREKKLMPCVKWRRSYNCYEIWIPLENQYFPLISHNPILLHFMHIFNEQYIRSIFMFMTIIISRFIFIYFMFNYIWV